MHSAMAVYDGLLSVCLIATPRKTTKTKNKLKTSSEKDPK